MPKTIRVIARTIEVMRLLDDAPALSLTAVASATGLPKASVLRVLATLEEQGLVNRAIGDGLYRSRVSFRVVPEARFEHLRLAEAASGPLRRLQQQVIWPSDVAVRAGWAMQLVETSRRVSGLSLVRDRLGHRVDMLMSAVGRAYLAWCSDDERDEIVEHLRQHPDDCVNAQRVTRAGVARVLGETRRQGYARRDPAFGGSAHPLREVDDGLTAIAVPIVVQPGEVAGCVNLVWPRRFHIEREVGRKLVPQVQAAAAEIAAALRDETRVAGHEAGSGEGPLARGPARAPASRTVTSRETAPTRLAGSSRAARSTRR